MKTKILILSLVSIFFAVVFSSCRKPESEKREPEKPINYPIEIPFDLYSLEGTECEWQNIPCNHKVIMINSNEELEKYVSCTEGSYRAIDFSKHTLLLVSGAHLEGIYDTKLGRLEQDAPSHYKLPVTVRFDTRALKKGWSYMLIVNKLHSESMVELNLTTIAYNTSHLYQSSWEIIQATVMGKWKVERFWHFFLDDVFAEVTSNSFSISGIKPEHWPFDSTSFIYSWEKISVPYTATVMRNDNDTLYGFDFRAILDGKRLFLDVFKNPSPDHCFEYTLVRVKD